MLQPHGLLMDMQNSLEVMLWFCELWIVMYRCGTNISKWIKCFGGFFHLKLRLILLLLLFSLFWMQISKGNWIIYTCFPSRKLIEWCYENPFIVVCAYGGNKLISHFFFPLYLKFIVSKVKKYAVFLHWVCIWDKEEMLFGRC